MARTARGCGRGSTTKVTPGLFGLAGTQQGYGVVRGAVVLQQGHVPGLSSRARQPAWLGQFFDSLRLKC